mgnify:CR=1 FL=1
MWARSPTIPATLASAALMVLIARRVREARVYSEIVPHSMPVAEMLAMADAGTLGRIHQIEANFSHDKFLSLARDNWRLKADQAPAGGMTITRQARLEYAIELIAAVRIDRHRQIEHVRFVAKIAGEICSHPAKSIATQAAPAVLWPSLLDRRPN